MLRFPSRTRRPFLRTTTVRYKPTVSTTTISRTRNPIKRKSSTTIKPQELSTTQSSRIASRFASRKPFFRLTTIKNIERAIKTYNADQALQSTSLNDLEKEKVDDTTTLSELAVALNQLQQASVRTQRNVTKPYLTPTHAMTTIQFNNIVSSTHRPLQTSPPTIYSPAPTANLKQTTMYRGPTSYQQILPTSYIIKKPRPFEKFGPHQMYDNANKNYDYYDEEVPRFVPQNSKVLIHSSGLVQCLDQGNFPHPASCKKFIYCAKVDTGDILGWEYTCPKNLSFDPVGGICNWSAGLGCHE